MHLTQDLLSDKKVIEQNSNIHTPYLITDLGRLKNNYQTLVNSLKGIEVFYAMKANNTPAICKMLMKEGASFEVASLNETKSLLEMGVLPEKIMCLNPIKSPEFLKWLHEKEIRVMAFDWYDELDKMAEYAPGSKAVIRISVSEEGSYYPLGNKFGTDPAGAIKMFLYAAEKGLLPYGITFHVGTQCLNSKNWELALLECRRIYNELKEKHNIELTLISLGGGIPIEYLTPTPTLGTIGTEIYEVTQKIFGDLKDIKITIEPGRGIVGNTCTLVGSVVGKAMRGDIQWLYLDVGVFNGVMEILGNFKFNYATDSKATPRLTMIAGPTCDSYDVLSEKIMFPDVKVGDKIYIEDVGAYSIVYASKFNGFEIPTVYFIE
jgi:ornithine decarboxylase